MISEAQLKSFEVHGFAVIHGFVDEQTVASIQEEMNVLREEGKFRPAAVGKGSNQAVISSERGDVILWIDPDTTRDAIRDYLQRMDELRGALNRHFYFGLEKFECHFAEYPVGTHYARHSDRHKTGSTRRVSTVLYLNRNWKEEDGGQLVLYPSTGPPAPVQPMEGTLAIFLSEMEHEVKATHRARRSITGWMHHRL